jgi:hypothetical protein
MTRTRATLVWIWLATTALVAAVGVLAYRSLTRVPELAGRTDPELIWEDPTVLFADPGVLGTAVEMKVTEAVRACMADKGQTFRGPAVAEDIYPILDPSSDGYGIAAGGDSPRPTLGAGGPSTDDRVAYETALYGGPLDGPDTTDGGCAAVGVQVLNDAVGTLEALPYSIDQLEADALADPQYQAALSSWVACMASKGHSVTTPDDLIAGLMGRLATSSGDDARALADEERRLAADDFSCRVITIDRTAQEVAIRLAPVFVERNRAQLETLIPPPHETAGTTLPPDLGSGDVQVTLVWRSKADLDLAVTDPTGAEVYYNYRTVVSGGTLDRDANYPCLTDAVSPAVENVFWPTGGAPPGDYTASVFYTNDCAQEGAQTFDLVIRVNGTIVHQETHTLSSPGDVVTVDFTGGSK